MKSEGLYNYEWINTDGNWVHKTAIIHPNVKMGRGNTIGAYAVIGSNGEIRDVSQDDFKGRVVIGNDNVISEHVTIQRPLQESESTVIGNENIIMAHAHIGHDSKIGNMTEICTSCVIGGYVVIEDSAKIKLHSVIRNRRIIGENATVGMGSVVTKDVLNGQVVYGNPAKQSSKVLTDNGNGLRKIDKK